MQTTRQHILQGATSLTQTIIQSTPERLKFEDVETHVYAIFVKICAKLLVLMRNRKNMHLFMILTQFDNIFLNVLHVFYGISAHSSA